MEKKELQKEENFSYEDGTSQQESDLQIEIEQALKQEVKQALEAEAKAQVGEDEEAQAGEDEEVQVGEDGVRTKNNKRKKKRNTVNILTTALLVVAAGVFLFSGYQLLSTWREYNAGEQQYDDLASMLPTYAETGSSNRPGTSSGETSSGGDSGEENSPGQAEPEDTRDWKAFYDEMKALNEDYVGWIMIEDTPINYPIVQAEDNDYYLHRLFDGTENFSGTLFADYRCEDLFTEGNTIIHGHNMKNGSMFAGLLNYQKSTFYPEHMTFSVYTEEGEVRYQVFAIYTTEPVSDAYITEFASDEQYVTWLQTMHDRSAVKTDVVLDADTSVITLSTCVHNNEDRLIVQAKRID